MKRIVTQWLCISKLLIALGLYAACAVTVTAAGYDPEPSFSFVSGLLYVKHPCWTKSIFQCIPPQQGAFISSYDWCITPASNLVVVWEEMLLDSSDSDIYAQLFLPNGSLLWRIPVNRFRGLQKNPKVAALPDNSVVVVWQSDSAGTYNHNIWAQRILFTGQLLWKTPAPICAYSGNQVNPAIAIDPEGDVIMAWEDFRHGNADIYSQRIEHDGSPVGPEDGVSIEAAPGHQKDVLFIYSTDKNAAAITWNDYSSSLSAPVQVEVNIERIPIPEPGSIFFLIFLAVFGFRKNGYRLSVIG
jgi:hypothetical protein